MMIVFFIVISLLQNGGVVSNFILEPAVLNFRNFLVFKLFPCCHVKSYMKQHILQIYVYKHNVNITVELLIYQLQIPGVTEFVICHIFQ